MRKTTVKSAKNPDKGEKMSTDEQIDPSGNDNMSPDEASELLISMSYEAITYLDRAIPVYKTIAEDIGKDEEKTKNAMEELGKAEDGLKWLALYIHQCVESSSDVLPDTIREKFVPFKANLLPALRQIVAELEKVDVKALPKVITEHMLPLFSELHVAAKEALEYLGQKIEEKK